MGADGNRPENKPENKPEEDTGSDSKPDINKPTTNTPSSDKNETVPDILPDTGGQRATLAIMSILLVCVGSIVLFFRGKKSKEQ